MASPSRCCPKGGGRVARSPARHFPRQLQLHPGLTLGSLAAWRGGPPLPSLFPSPFPCSALPPPLSSASTLHPPIPVCRELGSERAQSLPELRMWALDKSTAPPLKMDSRYTSTAGIGDLNQLSAAIPATRVEVSVSCR